MRGVWVSVKVAAALLGYSEDYFRRVFCDEARPLVVIRSWRGRKGVRRILVLRASVDQVLDAQVKTPA